MYPKMDETHILYIILGLWYILGPVRVGQSHLRHMQCVDGWSDHLRFQVNRQSSSHCSSLKVWYTETA
jgi:hypothetical protein